MKTIRFYHTPSGQRPIEDFLDRLSARQAQKVTWVFKVIEELDRVPAQYFKKMVNTEDLWEVRVTSGSDIFRFLGFFDGKDIVVLSYAFQKKTQKTPKQAIKIAEERKRDYLRRKKNE